MRGLVIRSTLLVFVLLLVGMAYVTHADGPVQGNTNSSGGSRIFTDVPANHWSMESLKYLLQRGVIQGLPSGKFEGDRAATRYEVAQMMSRLLNYVENLKNQAGGTNPDAKATTIKPEDLDVLRDLIYKVADKLNQLTTDVNTLKSARPDIDPNLTQRIQNLESQADEIKVLKTQVDDNEKTIRDLKTQLTQFQVKASTVTEEDLAKTNQQIIANRIIGLFALGAAIVGIGLMTLK